MIYGYIRVSTDHQTTENQRVEIERFCEKNDLKIDSWIEETISATKDQIGTPDKKSKKRRFDNSVRAVASGAKFVTDYEYFAPLHGRRGARVDNKGQLSSGGGHYQQVFGVCVRIVCGN